MPALILAHVDALGGAAPGPGDWSELARSWELSPLPLLGLLASAWLYRRGLRRLRAALREKPGRGLRRAEVAAFWCGWGALALALVSPLHPWGRALFSAHMTQHELLMVAAAPLLVLGRPGLAFVFALHREDARSLARALHAPRLRRAWTFLTRPLVAWALHAAALWTWHIPSFFQATLRNEFAHDLQHLCFFGSALLFWWALFEARPGPRGFGVAALYLFTTMAHTGFLGALLAFAKVALYPAYAPGAARWSLTALEDQQLGGFIMWVPAGLVYAAAALVLAAAWLRGAEKTFPAEGSGPGRDPDREAPGPGADLHAAQLLARRGVDH